MAKNQEPVRVSSTFTQPNSSKAIFNRVEANSGRRWLVNFNLLSATECKSVVVVVSETVDADWCDAIAFARHELVQLLGPREHGWIVHSVSINRSFERAKKN